MKKKLLAALAVVGSFVAASQAAQDWSSISTDVTAEISAVVPVALGVFGAVIAVVIGVRVFKRIAG